jgi:D-proline reductase (dithiol) PrdB
MERALMTKTVDSYRFVDSLTARVLRNWAAREPERQIPWTPLGKPLKDCTLALVSSAAIALKSDTPFDLEIERQNPWISDPSYRMIPRDATEKDVEIYHLHIDHKFAEQDLNCILPLGRLAELEASGEIGRVAPRHYSYIGYTCDVGALLEHSLPGMIRGLQEDAVDAVLLVPV